MEFFKTYKNENFKLRNFILIIPYFLIVSQTSIVQMIKKYLKAVLCYSNLIRNLNVIFL